MLRALLPLVPLTGVLRMVLGGIGRYRTIKTYEAQAGKTDYITFQQNIKKSPLGKEFLMYQRMFSLGTASFFLCSS